MRSIALFICLLFTTLVVEAQYTWCVSINGNTRLKNVSENKVQNKLLLSDKELNATGSFLIKFNRYDTSMRRTILVDDPSGAGIKSWEEVERSWQIKTTELKKLLETAGALTFYYTEIPRDVNKAVLIRVRPVHLCTVNRSPK